MFVWYSLAAVAALFWHARGLPSSQLSTIVDCGQFSDTPDGPRTPKTDCTKYSHLVFNQVGKTTVDFYRPIQNWAPKDAATKRHIQDIHDAIVSVVPAYQKFKMPSNLVLIVVTEPALSNDPNFVTTGLTKQKPGTFDPCWVRIENNLPAQLEIDMPTEVKHTVAHELYHCVQTYSRQKDDDYDGTAWWYEGAADFFAFTFYPAHGSDTSIRNYDPSAPLYDQSLSGKSKVSDEYSCSLFFMFLTNIGWTTQDINSFVVSQPTTKSLSSGRAAAAADAKIRDTFPLFAQAYWDDTIVFNKDQSPVLPRNTIVSLIMNVDILSDGQLQTINLKIKTFTMKHFRLNSFQTGHTYRVEWHPKSENVVLSYRSVDGSSNKWTRYPGTAVPLPVPCTGGNLDLEFIITSTDNVDTDEGTLMVTQVSHKDCDCQHLEDRAESSGISSRTNTCQSNTIDPCLIGTWVLNLSAFKALVEAQFAKLPADDKVTNLKVSGSATFSIPPATPSSTFIFDHTQLSYNVDAEGIAAFTNIDINGSVKSAITTDDNGHFSWSDSHATGVAHSTITITGESPSVIDLPLDQDYGPAIKGSYVCTAKTLDLAGVLDGKYAWSYSFNKA